MNPAELLYVAGLWGEYFPREVFIAQDPRLAGITMFRDFFKSEQGSCLLDSQALSTQRYVYFNIKYLNETLPFSDFELSLKMRPTEVMGFIGIALSLLAKQQNPHCEEQFIIHPRFYGLSSDTCFGDIKSSTVGQVVSVRGHVVRVSPCRPLVQSASFLCAKCMKFTFSKLEDGIFLPPVVCSTEKCYNKFLELDRSTVSTSDYQRIKLTELDEAVQTEIQKGKGSGSEGDGGVNGIGMGDFLSAHTARVPRTLEIEVRDTLVNTCVPGDVLCALGVVKSVQMEAPKGGGKGGYKESGLHVLYLLANSLVCLKGSGDRAELPSSLKPSTCTNPSQIVPVTAAAASTQQLPLTFLDGDISNGSNKLLRTQSTAPVLSPNGASNANSTSSSNSLCSGQQAQFSPGELSVVRAIALSGIAFPLLVHSLCPTIFGHELVKMGLLMGLFGGSSYKSRPQQQKKGHQDNQNYQDNQESCGGERFVDEPIAPPSSKEFQVRADIHVLVVGDPGLGKSQMLRAAATVAPRAVFVTGNTSTAAGLTVSISRDSSGGGKGGGDLCIEAGALILADQGVCCIDELDKITADQHALLEAMEQQSISIAKSGVVTSLKSRTSVLAAANPAGGHYNRKKTVCENLKMNAALLSRFDLIFILLDRPDESHDRMISEHIMGSSSNKRNRSAWEDGNNNNNNNNNSNSNSSGNAITSYDGALTSLQQRLRHMIQANLPSPHSSSFSSFSNSSSSSSSSAASPVVRQLQRGGVVDNVGVIHVEIMRRYIEYARQYVHPHLSPAAAKVLQRLYLTMRAEASAGQSIPITTRHLESLIRLSQARARMELRDEVTAEDANDVVQLLQESLLDVFTNESGAIDAGRKGGISLAKQVKALVKVMTREASLRGSNMFSKQDISDLCSKLALDKEVDSLIDVMRSECYLLLKGPRLYQLQTAG